MHSVTHLLQLHYVRSLGFCLPSFLSTRIFLDYIHALACSLALFALLFVCSHLTHSVCTYCIIYVHIWWRITQLANNERLLAALSVCQSIYVCIYIYLSICPFSRVLVSQANYFCARKAAAATCLLACLRPVKWVTQSMFPLLCYQSHARELPSERASERA